MTRTIFVTFAGGRTGWKQAAKRICSEAKETGLFQSVYSLDESWWATWDPLVYRIGLGLRNNFGPKGFGYWIWKTSVLNWADVNFPHFQILYLDAGTQIYRNKESIHKFSNLLKTSQEENGLAWALPNHSEKQWTKKELLSASNLSMTDQVSNQIQSGFVALPPNSDRSLFISEFRNWGLIENGFYFTEQEKEIQDKEFIEHRYDQSVFSCLWKKYKKKEFLDITDPVNLGVSPVIAFRNNSNLTLPTSLLKRKFHLVKNLSIDLLMGRK
jgi:hypothetical protein